MQATCGQCGAKYALDDKLVAKHPKVQFKCAKCGHTTVVHVTAPAERTQSVTPLPSFAQSGGRSAASILTDPYAGLELPHNKNVVVTLLSGPSKGLTHKLTTPRVVLGRKSVGADADIQVDDKEVSRWHCAVEVKGEVVRLRDLDSTNGTYFEEVRVRAAELQNNSEFRIGSTIVRISIIPKQG